MEVSLFVNGVALEGINPSSVKLTLSNVDPFTGGDQKVAYSSSFKVPRSAINDMVFASERSFGLIPRTSRYTAVLAYDGFPAPVGAGEFDITCKADESGYTLSVRQSAIKMSSVPCPLQKTNYLLRVLSDPKNLVYNVDLEEVIANAIGPCDIPTMVTTAGSSRPNHRFFSTIDSALYADMLGMSWMLTFKGQYNVNNAGRYPDNTLIYSSTMASWVLESNTTGEAAKFSLGMVSNSYIICDASVVGSATDVYLHPNSTDTTKVTGQIRFAKVSDPTPAGTYKFKSVNAGRILCSMPPDNYHFSTSTSRTAAYIKPSTKVSTSAALNLSVYVASITKIGTMEGVVIPKDFASSDASTLVSNLCKTHLWRYSYDPETRTTVFSDIIHKDARAAGNQPNAKRIVWEGKLVGNLTVSDYSGAAKILRCQTGDLVNFVGLSEFSLNESAAGAGSDLSVHQVGYVVPNYCVMGSGMHYPDQVDYFTSPEGYKPYLDNYYAPFKEGIVITANMRLSYEDIRTFQADAFYMVKELNQWFYVKDIANWNALDGGCTVTLIKVTLP